VSRFAVSATDPNAANPNSELVILQIPQHFITNHNGGMLAFGPTATSMWGWRWRPGGDPLGTVRTPPPWLGRSSHMTANASADTIRHPADGPFAGNLAPAARYGPRLRNPWRFSFDAPTGQLWVGDGPGPL